METIGPEIGRASCRTSYVSTLPIRNGNHVYPTKIGVHWKSMLVSTLPIRNGKLYNLFFVVAMFCKCLTYKEWKRNALAHKGLHDSSVSTLPIRNGNTHCLIIGKVKRIKRKYLTYKEWKHNEKRYLPLCETV